MKNIFVDTNIVLDVLTHRQPYFKDAAEIWTLCETGELQAHISVISFNNIFYVARKLRGKETAYHMLGLLRGVFHPVSLDGQGIQQAMDAGLADFEDAIQFHAAIRCAADVLITRNPGHFPNSGPPILSPREFLAAYQASQPQSCGTITHGIFPGTH
jgi:predicted nucleic acid-binding protein